MSYLWNSSPLPAAEGLRVPRGIDHRLSKPAPHVPVRRERAGDLGPLYRLNTPPLLVPRYREAIALHLTVTGGDLEQKQSGILHAPFLVERVSVFSGQAAITDATVTLFIGTELAATPFTVQRFSHALVRQHRDGSTGQELTVLGYDGNFEIGALIREVPTRLNMVVNNGGAAIEQITAIFYVLHFAEAACCTDPMAVNPAYPEARPAR